MIGPTQPILNSGHNSSERRVPYGNRFNAKDDNRRGGPGRQVSAFSLGSGGVWNSGPQNSRDRGTPGAGAGAAYAGLRQRRDQSSRKDHSGHRLAITIPI